MTVFVGGKCRIDIQATRFGLSDSTPGKQDDKSDPSDFPVSASDLNDLVKSVNTSGDMTVSINIDGAADGANFVDARSSQGAVLTNINQAMTEGKLQLS